MSYNDILKIVPVVQSAALVGNSMSFLKKKKKRTSDFLQNATETMVGSNLIKETAHFI